MKNAIIPRILVTAGMLLFTIHGCLGQDDPAGQLAGSWIKVTDNTTVSMNFISGDKVEVEFTGDDVIDVYASYVIDGTRITFTDEAGEYSSGTSGVYSFVLGEDSVTFTRLDDPVEGRSILLSGRWSRAGD